MDYSKNAFRDFDSGRLFYSGKLGNGSKLSDRFGADFL
jgi:hypothetical protein